MDIAEFLLARIAEDEAWARARLAEVPEWRNPAKDLGGVPVRLLAECEAKRRIVEEAFLNAEDIDGEWGDGHLAAEIRAGACDDRGAESAARFLRLLALPHAGHPDYREEWAPEPATAAARQ